MMKRTTVAILFFLSSIGFSQDYVLVSPKQGDGIYSILKRYLLPSDKSFVETFNTLNSLPVGNKNIKLHRTYKIPVFRYVYNGVNIRTTLNMEYDQAKKIQNYNEALLQKGVKKYHYTANKDLWVPEHLLTEKPETALPDTLEEIPQNMSGSYKIFGKKYQQVSQIDEKLKGHIYYVVSGHGGPDPGAMGKRAGHTMCEDEYAYDITLRLARRLIEHGALVYVIVRDPNDGIRDKKYLKKDSDEYYYGGGKIHRDALTRLDQRVNVINDLYNKNKPVAKSQNVIAIHLDSRSTAKRVDIFYYYQEKVDKSKKMAESLFDTIKKKYQQHQPNRGYTGKILTRGLYMLRHCKPTTVYIELGNIRNSLDQDRFVQTDNRQAVANWLCDGLINTLY